MAPLIDWVPGEPLYQDPRDVLWDSNHDPQFVRELFQVREDHVDNCIRCNGFDAEPGVVWKDVMTHEVKATDY